MGRNQEFPYRLVGKGAAKSSSSSLGASDEIRLVSLAPDGLECIVGVGRSQISLNRVSFPEHEHPGCIELHFCLRGSLVFSAGGETFRCLPGDIFLTQPDMAHHLVERKRGQRHFWMMFRFPKRGDAPILGLDARESALLCRRLAAIRHCRFRGDERLRTLFQNIFDICEAEPRRGTLRTIRLKAVVLDLLLVVMDCAEREASKPEHANKRLLGIIEAIRADPARAASIGELAQAAALSESRFAFLFKLATGLPPHAFIMACRMEETKRRLRDTGDPIAKIASDMGFASARHLAVQFRQHCACSPRQFRAGAR